MLAARARREKILAEKNKQSETLPTTSKNAAPKQEPPANAPPRHAAPPAAAKVQNIIPPPRGPDPAVLRAIRPPSVKAPKKEYPAVLAGAARGAKQMFGRNAMIAVACCAALGFGLSFGFSTAVGIGSLSRPETATASEGIAKANAQPVEASDLSATTSEDQPAVPGTDDTSENAAEPSGAQLSDASPSAPVFDIDPEKRPVERPQTIPSALAVPRPKIHVYAPDSVTTATLDQNKSQLNTGGFQIADVKRVGMTISAPHVRFYDPTDAAIASTLADNLQIEARDFSESGNGAPGRIEVWLNGTSDSRRRSPNPVDELIRFGNRLIRNLQ